MKKKPKHCLVSLFLVLLLRALPVTSGTARDFACSDLERKQIVDIWPVNERLAFLMLAQHDTDTPNTTDYRVIVYDYRHNEFLNVHLLDENHSGRQQQQPTQPTQKRNQISGKFYCSPLFQLERLPLAAIILFFTIIQLFCCSLLSLAIFCVLFPSHLLFIFIFSFSIVLFTIFLTTVCYCYRYCYECFFQCFVLCF